ncbi:MAG: ornithine carbamoyltransferase [Actinobacteria bacterium]|nr:ornithine carbamoyltransferase [Actinomycetota bacterium]
MKNLLDKKHKDLLTLKDYSKEEIENILKLAAEVKKDKKLYKDLLSGKNLAMLFDKHSTRTRLSFEVGISQLGGNSIYLDSKNLQIKRGETLEDTAKVFSKYLDGVIIRTYSQKTVEVFARESMIPVINGLTDLYHPCQILSDLFTIYELGLLKKDLKFTYVGDSNNVLNSLLIGFTILGLNITVGCPEKYKPLKEVINYIKKQSEISGSNFKIVNDPLEAVADADIVYTDVWVSMGDKESAGKIKELKNFQINLKLLSYAKPDVKIMHCLPAHRGEEITSEAIDGNNSIVWVQAENRLHAQKALLVYLYSI